MIRGGYDPEVLLKKLSGILSSTIGFEKMLNSLVETLIKGLNIKSASIALVNPEQDKQSQIIIHGDKKKQWKDVNRLIEHFRNHEKPLFIEELAYAGNPKNKSEKQTGGYGRAA